MLPLQTEEPTTPQELIFQSTKSGAAEIPADAEMSHCSPKQRAALEDLAPRSHQTGAGRLRPPLPHRGFWGGMGAPSTGRAGLSRTQQWAPGRARCPASICPGHKLLSGSRGGPVFQRTCHLQLKRPLPRGICLFSAFCWMRFSGSTFYKSRFYFSLHPM